MRRRALLLLLALSLALPLPACGRESGPEETPAPEPGAVVVQTPRPTNDNTGVKPRGTLLGSLACDTAYWTAFSEIWEIPEDGSLTKRFVNYTDGLALWDNYLVILQSTPEGHSAEEAEGYREYAVLRADNYGWGEGYKDAARESDWDWASFTEDLNGALIELTVANHGGKADVRVTATTADGRVYHQSCTGIPVDGSLYLCLSVENACLELLS